MTCVPSDERRAGPGPPSTSSTLALAGAHLDALVQRLDRGDLAGARRHAEQARALVGDVLRPREAPDLAVHAGDRLSPAELKVLVLLDSYRSLPEIATELFLSRNTVKSHVRSIYAKLAVSRRSDAVRAAQAHGLLPEQATGRMP